MFTGIVEERGVVREVSPTRLSIGCRTVTSDATEGASIAVNGACLTVVERSDEHLAFDVSEETLRRTSFSRLRAGDPVNLERPLTLSSRLGGHLVQGHVDGVGEVIAIEPPGEGDGSRSGARGGPPLPRGEGLGVRGRDQPDRRRSERRRVLDRRDPAHPGRDDAPDRPAGVTR
jgi:riboflavin synthase